MSNVCISLDWKDKQFHDFFIFFVTKSDKNDANLKQLQRQLATL